MGVRATERSSPHSAVLPFVIADVRGNTAFSRSAGDEAAAGLAAAFAEIMREGVEANGGAVLELRGDEALGVDSIRPPPQERLKSHIGDSALKSRTRRLQASQ